MEIIVGKLAGFCGGVINSVSKTKELLKSRDSIFCLGELVHNKQVVDELVNMGMKVVESIEDVLDGSELIVRAHGVPKSIYEEAQNRNITLYDLTCPNVLKIHEKAQNLVNEGFFIILIAQKIHPEAIGTISFCGENSIILEDDEDLLDVIDKYRKSDLNRIAIISQTTFSVIKFEYLVNQLKFQLEDNIDLLICNTICSATDLRQKETAIISKKVDAMVIIGGKNSSNTKKLYELSLKNCSNVFIIETLDDLVDDMSKYSIVGVMAGASTPKESIEDVIRYLESI